MQHEIVVEAIAADALAAAAALLRRFFAEEGFAGDENKIAANLARMVDDPHHWSALARVGSAPVGVVTVTTMLYVEWGRLGEMGDLYVLPKLRQRGIARRLIASALDWCQRQGCSAVSVVITPEAEAAHGLGKFYQHLGFEPSGRTISTKKLF